MLWRNVFFSRLFFWYLKQQLVRVLLWIKLWIVKACRIARVFLQFFSDDILILLFLFLWCHFQRYFIFFPPMAIYETWIISTYQIVSAWLLNKLAYYIPTLYILHLCLLCNYCWYLLHILIFAKSLQNVWQIRKMFNHCVLKRYFNQEFHIVLKNSDEGSVKNT